MYLYPDDLKARPTLWLWTLRDIIIICCGAVVSFFALAKTGFSPPLALTAAYAILTSRVNNACILDYALKAYRFLAGQQQYLWRGAHEQNP